MSHPTTSADAWLLAPGADDFEMIVGSIDQGVLVLDDQRQRVVALNQVLAALLPQLDPQKLTSMSPLEWIAPSSRGAFLNLGSAGPREEPLRIRLGADDGPTVEVRGSYRVNAGGVGRWIYWLTPVREGNELELKLEREAHAQKRRAAEALRTSLQIYQVTEKIRAAPRLSALLIGVREESELYQRVGSFLLSEAIHARFVRILIADTEGRLRCVYSSSGDSDDEAEEPAGAPLDGVLIGKRRGELNPESRWEPLERRDETIGLLEIRLDPREEQLLEEAPLFRKWLEESIRTLAEIVALFDENIRLYHQLEVQARHDGLTGLYNRHHLLEELDRDVGRAHREGTPLSVIFVDLDRFKELNDGHGHAVGDRVLAGFAGLLRGAFRETDYLCRYGGDEFVAILPSTEVDEAMRKTEQLLDDVRGRKFRVDETGDEIQLTLSIGVAGLESEENARALLKRADEALYVSKRNGRNQAQLAPSARDRDHEAAS